MADINIKGRYRLYTHDGTIPFDFTTYANNLCVIRRPNENTFVTVRQYVPGPGAKPFTTFEPGSSYTISTKTNDSVFSMGPYTRSDRLPSSTTIKSPIFYIGLDRNSIPVPLSSYTLGANSPLSTIRTTEANLNGFYTNFTTFDANSYKIGFNQGFTHLQPGSSYELRNRVPFTLFAPLQSEMGNVYVMGNNEHGQFGLGHMLSFTIPPYRQSTSSRTISAENIYGNWYKIIENLGSVLALSACGTKKKLFACGRNDYGQLGLGYTSPLSTTVTVFYYVPHPTNNDYGWEDIATGLHSLAVDEWGELYSCGYNFNGQLGLGDSGLGTNRNIFTQVNTNFQHGINPVETDPTSICTGHFHSLVRDQNGDLWSCGLNANGQLGLGDTNQRNDFTLVGNIGYQDIGAGAYCSAYLSNNRMYACGRNDFGQFQSTLHRIGTSSESTNSNVTTFTQELNGFTDIENLWVGGRGIFVKRSSSNVLYACGNNSWGNLGMPVSNTTSSGHYINLDKRILSPTIIPSNFYKFFPSLYTSFSFSSRSYPYWIDSSEYELKTIIESDSSNGTTTLYTPTIKGTGLTVSNINGNTNTSTNFSSVLFFDKSQPPTRTPTPTPTKTPTPTPTPTPVPGIDKFALIAQQADTTFSNLTNSWSQIWEYNNNNFITPTKILAVNYFTTNTTQGFQPQNSLNINTQVLFDYEKGAYSNLIAILSNPKTGTRSVYRCTSSSNSTWTLISTPSQLNFCSGVNNQQSPTYTSLGEDILFIDKNNTYYYYSFYCGNGDTDQVNNILYISSSTDRGATWSAQTAILDKNTFGSAPYAANYSIYGAAMKAVQDNDNNSNHKLFVPLRNGKIVQYSPGSSFSYYINPSLYSVGPFDVISENNNFYETHVMREGAYVDGYSLYLNGNVVISYTTNKIATDYNTTWENTANQSNADRNRRGGFISLAKKGNIYYILYTRRTTTAALGSAKTNDRAGISLIEYNSSDNTYTDTFIAGRQYDGSPLFTFDNTRYPVNNGTSPTGQLLSLKLLVLQDSSLIAFCMVGELTGFLDGRSCIYSFKRDPITKVWTKLSGPNNYLTSNYTSNPGPYAMSYAFYSTRYI